MGSRQRVIAAAGVLWIGAVAGLHAQGGGRQQPRLVLKALDLDGDGTLSAEEIKAAPASLLKLDTNGDGSITMDELTDRPANAGASSDQLAQQLMSFDKAGKGYLVASDLPDRMQGIFTRADANHDGRLTPDEIRALSTRQGMPAGSTAPGKANGMFRTDPLLEALDTDHDGMLQASEIAAASASLLTLDRNGDGRLTPDEMPLRQQTVDDRVNHMLDEWDTDRDGRISKAEAPDRMQQQFDTLDANHDGYLDRAELRAFFAAQAGAGGQGARPQPAASAQGARPAGSQQPPQ